MRKPRHTIQFRLTKVTPRMARGWLETVNTHNRKLREGWVSQLSRDMINGNWEPTHQGIAFDENGVLQDGQHRLAAAVKANRPVWMYVARNASSEMAFIDLGAKRSQADILTLAGESGKVTNFDVATLRAMLRGNRSFLPPMTPAETKEALNAHCDAIDFAIKKMGSSGRVRGITTGTTRAVVARAYYSTDHDKLGEFSQKLMGATWSGNGDMPIRLLWTYLVNQGSTRGGNDLRDRYGKTERALHAFLNNEQITKLYGSTSELFPLPEEIKTQ